jgi:hypothetical protein
MRENRTSGSEGGEPVQSRLSYPYHAPKRSSIHLESYLWAITEGNRENGESKFAWIHDFDHGAGPGWDVGSTQLEIKWLRAKSDEALPPPAATQSSDKMVESE